MPEFSWIKTELSRFFPDADFSKGVDLNRNGKLEMDECIVDANNNGIVGDSGDWEVFLKKNACIQNLGGIFKWGAALRPDNPLHDVITIESELENSSHKAYELVALILQRVKAALQGKELTPQQKLHLIYKEMNSAIFLFIRKYPTFLQSITQDPPVLDCYGWHVVVLAVAHEIGWPVHLVLTPHHAFIRWDDGKGTCFNMDTVDGVVESDDFYAKKYNIPEESIHREIYLKNLTRKEFLAFIFVKRGIAKQLMGNYQAAIEDHNKAIELNPTFAMAFINRGIANNNLGNYQAAILDYDQTIQLNQNYVIAFQYRAKAKEITGDNTGASQDRDRYEILSKGFLSWLYEKF